MELKQLEAFVAVVDYNSFSEAARHLFLTQNWIRNSFPVQLRNCMSPLRDTIFMIQPFPC